MSPLNQLNHDDCNLYHMLSQLISVIMILKSLVAVGFQNVWQGWFRYIFNKMHKDIWERKEPSAWNQLPEILYQSEILHRLKFLLWERRYEA